MTDKIVRPTHAAPPVVALALLRGAAGFSGFAACGSTTKINLTDPLAKACPFAND